MGMGHKVGTPHTRDIVEGADSMWVNVVPPGQQHGIGAGAGDWECFHEGMIEGARGRDLDEVLAAAYDGNAGYGPVDGVVEHGHLKQPLLVIGSHDDVLKTLDEIV